MIQDLIMMCVRCITERSLFEAATTLPNDLIVSVCFSNAESAGANCSDPDNDLLFGVGALQGVRLLSFACCCVAYKYVCFVYIEVFGGRVSVRISGVITLALCVPNVICGPFPVRLRIYLGECRTFRQNSIK